LRKDLESGSLVWDDSLGFGFCDTPAIDYDKDYFDHYLKLDETPTGKELVEFRRSLVDTRTQHVPIDIGIGGGAFVNAKNCFGYDINRKAVEWLKSIGKYVNPYISPVKCLTFWDSLEHIPHPTTLLNRVESGGMVFVSIPVFEGFEQCLRSKHFKPGEHLWYWTHEGFIMFMDGLNFKLMEWTNKESIIGRESVHTYVFQRL